MKKDKLPLALLGCDAPDKVEDALRGRGFEICRLPAYERLPRPVASHADMLLFCDGRRIFAPKKYLSGKRELKKALRGRGFKTVACREPLDGKYPYDIALNFAKAGRLVYGKLPHMAKKLKSYVVKMGYDTAVTNQGYARCSSVILGEYGIITADPSIEKMARQRELDLLKITNSGITLKGYDCGFIGGCCGVWQNTVYFTGSISSHPQAEEIRAFCAERGFECISLTEMPLFDIGGIIFIK